MIGWTAIRYADKMAGMYEGDELKEMILGG